MIDWMWPYAFTALPLPLLVRYLWSRAKRPEPALQVPNLQYFAGLSEGSSWPG